MIDEMTKTSIQRSFENMGAKITITETSGTLVGNPLRINVLGRGSGRHFDINIDGGLESLRVLQTDAKGRHLLLMARGSGRHDDLRWLCGHDERDWFVAAVPGTPSTVTEAREALKPVGVAAAQRRLKPKEKRKRRNSAFKRQGEWFFIPKPDLQVPEAEILRNEPIRAGAKSAHMCEFLYRFGGEAVMVSSHAPNGLTPKEYEQYIAENQEAKHDHWRHMTRGANVYAKGKIRHSDHVTLKLNCWHEVQINTEGESRAFGGVAFLD